MARVRNDGKAARILTAFAPASGESETMVRTDFVAISPGQEVEVADRFLATQGARDLFESGDLVDVEAESAALIAKAEATMDEAKAAAEAAELLAKAEAEATAAAEALAAEEAAKAAADALAAEAETQSRAGRRK